MKWREEMDGGEMHSNGAISSSNRSLREGKVEKHDYLTGRGARATAQQTRIHVSLTSIVKPKLN